MSLRIEGSLIRIEGRCRLEEAETLLDALLRLDSPRVDLTGCTALHTAVVQILLASRVPVAGQPDAPFLVRHILPLLAPDASASVAGPGAL